MQKNKKQKTIALFFLHDFIVENVKTAIMTFNRGQYQRNISI